MGETVIIREATIDDAPAIWRMVRALAVDIGKESDVDSTDCDIAREGFGEAPAFEALIAEEAGEAVGLALYFPEFSTWRGKRGVYLQDLYVEGRLRRGGLGRRLVEALAVRACAHGAAYLRLSVDAANAKAAAFYERLGFSEAGDERIFKLKGAAFSVLSGANKAEE